MCVSGAYVCYTFLPVHGHEYIFWRIDTVKCFLSIQLSLFSVRLPFLILSSYHLLILSPCLLLILSPCLLLILIFSVSFLLLRVFSLSFLLVFSPSPCHVFSSSFLLIFSVSFLLLRVFSLSFLLVSSSFLLSSHIEGLPSPSDDLLLKTTHLLHGCHPQGDKPATTLVGSNHPSMSGGQGSGV